jgi:hypothetical protein
MSLALWIALGWIGGIAVLCAWLWIDNRHDRRALKALTEEE